MLHGKTSSSCDLQLTCKDDKLTTGPKLYTSDCQLLLAQHSGKRLILQLSLPLRPIFRQLRQNSCVWRFVKTSQSRLFIDSHETTPVSCDGSMLGWRSGWWGVFAPPLGFAGGHHRFLFLGGSGLTMQKTRHVNSVLFSCWASVCDAGPT